MSNTLVEVTVVSHVAECKQALESQLENAARVIAGSMETNAKVEITKAVYDTPPAKSGYVRTGNLRNSLTARPAKDRTGHIVVVGTNVEYAPYVELGTYRMGARPYLRPAVENHADEYRSILEDELRK